MSFALFLHLGEFPPILAFASAGLHFSALWFLWSSVFVCFVFLRLEVECCLLELSVVLGFESRELVFFLSAWVLPHHWTHIGFFPRLCQHLSSWLLCEGAFVMWQQCN